MNKKRIKGLWVFIVALIVCYVLKTNIRSDFYSVSLGNEDFRHRYLDDYTYDSCQPVEYTGSSNAGVEVYTLVNHALSLKRGKYDIGFGYYTANDDTTVLKIFASDYTSPDNSGGKILIYEKLNAEEGYLKTTFELDQDVHSVYILAETKDSNFNVNSMLIESWDTVCNDTYFYMALTILCALLLFVAMNMNWTAVEPISIEGHSSTSAKTVLGVVAVTVIAVVVASLPLLKEAFIIGHDFTFHTARIEGMAQGLKSGQFPVRVHGGLLNGYGYANSMFYPELLMYFPAMLSVLGVSTITAFKAYIVFINFLTFICSYIPFKKMTDSRYMALTMSIVYLLNPYRQICAYYRSAIGEFAALTFLPLVMYGLYAVLKGNQKDWWCLVVGATGLLQCHILTTELTAFLAVIVVLIYIKNLFTKEYRLITLIKSGVYAVFLNLWFICPMLYMILRLRPIVFTRVQSPMGFAKKDLSYLFTTASVTGIGPHTLGWVSLGAIAFYILYRIFVEHKKEDSDIISYNDILLWTAVVCAIATTAYFPWSKITAIPVVGKMLDTIQFPYRLMSLVGVCCTILFGYSIILWVKNKKNRIIACICAVLVSTFTIGLFYEFVFVRTDTGQTPSKHYHVTNLNNSLCAGQYEYLPSSADLYDMLSYSPEITSENETMAISNWVRSGTTMEFDYSMNLTGTDRDIIAVPFTFIPGYEVEINGAETEVFRAGNSQVGFKPVQENGKVRIKYTEPLIFMPFNFISIITLILFITPKKYFGFIPKKFLDLIK